MKKVLLSIMLIASLATPAHATGGSTYKSIGDAIKVLKVAPESRTGYVRDKFKHWVNIDGNKQGCDARKSAIIRDAVTKPTVEAGCVLTGGKWLSAYDNVTVDKAGSLDVDHMVPLAEAWDSGANAWTDDKRRAYANDLTDPRHLRSVTGPSNRSKSDRDPAEWLPTNTAYLCTYLTDWVEIKVRWSLTVDDKELKALQDNSSKCPKVKITVLPLPVTK
jgi:hypothetical protein